MESRAVIRLCRREDLRALEWEGVFSHHREIFDRTYAEQQAGRQVMLVAEVDGSPKGQTWIDLFAGRERLAGVIWAVRVHPDLYGRGVGTLLICESERVIRAHGLRAAELEVEAANTAARRLYQRLGYLITGRLGHTYSYMTPEGTPREHALDLFQMRKDLDSACAGRS